MASEAAQKNWTGTHGAALYRQTAAFTRLLENNYARYVSRPLQDASILDFGCGYGRFVRMLYYFRDPGDFWAVDAWNTSLQNCRSCHLPGNFGLSEVEPDSLPVGETKFDLAFAFSIFTHLSPTTAIKCLAGIRKHMVEGGILVATVRPVEFWTFYDQQKKISIAQDMRKAHEETGFAYLPKPGDGGKTYGDISLKLEYMAQDGWRLEGYDTTSIDAYQIAAILRAVPPSAQNGVRVKKKSLVSESA